MNNYHNNQTIIITGANSGLGLRISLFFIKKNYELVLCSRKLTNIKKILKKLKNINYKKIHFVESDISKKKDINKIKNIIKNKLNNNVDVLINNASIIGPIGDFSDNKINDWIKTINTNLIGSAMMTQLVIPFFKRKKKGKIIQIAGGGASGPFPNFSAYATSKVGIVRFMETISKELEKYNIDVNCVAPGILNTNMQKKVIKAGSEKVGTDYYKKISKNINKNNDFNKPINLIEFLISDKSNGITGKLISAVWDNWQIFTKNKKKLKETDVFTLRRIIGKNRNFKSADN
jgi:short-subunit dehydrogenase